jgi:pimeloyl-ACP methyl ester carboxylesterase
MAQLRVNDVQVSYELTGQGEPLVLVHGSWSDHFSWQAVVPRLTSSFRVLTYDRRGHSPSERPPGAGSRREDEDDLAALLEALDLAPAHAAGNSFGASIVLGLAARRPELFRSVVAHEPPLLAIVADEPELRPLVQDVQSKADSVVEQLQEGDALGGARRFVEEIAFGAGMWEQLPPQVRETFVRNAPTWLEEQEDPEWGTLDLRGLARFRGPALLTQGDQSPPWFSKIVQRLAEALTHAETRTYNGAGHAPQITHPELYASSVSEFLSRGRAASP